MRISVFVFSVLLMCSAYDAQGQKTAEWFRVDADGVSFMMPQRPEESVQTENGIPAHIYRTRNFLCIFGAVCSDFSGNAEMLAPEYRGRMIEILKAGSVPKEEYGKLSGERLVSEENPFIYEITYTVQHDKIQWSYVKRFVIDGLHLYQFTAGSKTRHSDELKVESKRYFDSVSLKTEPE